MSICRSASAISPGEDNKTLLNHKLNSVLTYLSWHWQQWDSVVTQHCSISSSAIQDSHILYKLHSLINNEYWWQIERQTYRLCKNSVSFLLNRLIFKKLDWIVVEAKHSKIFVNVTHVQKSWALFTFNKVMLVSKDSLCLCFKTFSNLRKHVAATLKMNP